MAILGQKALEELETEGIIAFSDRLPFSAFSLDLRLDKLYRRKFSLCIDTLEEGGMSQEEYLNRMTEEVDIPLEGLVISRDNFHLWQPSEEIFLPSGMRGEITSRSSWARLGSRVQSVDDYLSQYHSEKWVKPVCTLKMTGTNVLVQKGDIMAQLFFDTGSPPVLTSVVKKMIDNQELLLMRDGKALDSQDVAFQGGLLLTMGRTIKIYRGSLLIPGKLKESDFETVTLNHFQDYYLPASTFFISSSAEYVEIPDHCVGYVSESDSLMALSTKKTDRLIPFYTHANAPYIGPRGVFRGTITFENVMKMDGYIRVGIKQSELYLVPLDGAHHQAPESRYNGQQESTLSRL